MEIKKKKKAGRQFQGKKLINKKETCVCWVVFNREIRRNGRGEVGGWVGGPNKLSLAY